MRELSGVTLALGLVFMLNLSVKVKCACSVGYIEDSGTCRAPRWNETCNGTVDCEGSSCLNNICQCQNSEYFNASSFRCTPRLTHSAECDPTLDQCISPLKCIRDTNQMDRCLCSPRTSNFWTDGIGCRSITSLKAKSLFSSQRSTTYFTLNWNMPEAIPQRAVYYIYIIGVSPEQMLIGHPTSYTLTSLTPGDSYVLDILTILQDDYPNYPAQRTRPSFFRVYTFPAQPGPVDERRSFLITPPYSVTFGASEGAVLWYNFVLTSSATDGQSTYTLNGKITKLDLNLTENTVYQYRILAYNYASDASEPRIGTFSTNSTQKDYGAQCDNIPGECKDGFSCLSSEGSTTCQCTYGNYYNQEPQNPKCLPRKAFGAQCNNTIPGECKDVFNCTNSENSTSCQCPSDNYYNQEPQNPKCLPRLTHAVWCDPNLNPCIPSLVCVKDTKDRDRCLCNPTDSSLWTNGLGCRSVSNLTVSPTVPPSGRKTTSIELNWSHTVSPLPSGLYYNAVRSSASTNVFTRTSHLFTALTPGTMHSLSIKTILRSDVYYPERSTSSKPQNVYTLPAQPGPVDARQSSLITPPYNVTFGASEGNVDKYKFSITSPTIDGQSIFTLTGTTSTPTLNCKANTKYQYQIIAIRGSDESAPRIGTFSTIYNSLSSGPVKVVSVTPQEYNATIKWRVPDSPNGVLTGYSIQVNKNSACQYLLLMKCEDCNIPRDCEVKRTDKYKDADLTTTMNVEVTLTSLDPYQEYTAIVSAFNAKGQGTPYPQSFYTQIAAPQEIRSVILTPLEKDSNNQVALKINWTPGKFTGPTNFILKIFRETSLNSETFEVDSTINVAGYENTSYTMPDVLAYWKYRVQVQAVTEKGSSEFFNSSTQTQPSVPGGEMGVQIEKDPKIAAKVDMTLTCPEETMRNGKDWTFEIERQPRFTSQRIRSVNAGNCTGPISEVDTDVAVGTNYTYKVSFVNHKYKGQFTESSVVHLKPKAPVLETVTQVFLSLDESTEQTTRSSTIKIDLATDSLREISKKQGTISNMALIVCAKSTNNPCNGIPKRTKRSLTAAELGSYYTYDEARNRGFTVPYRATPNEWHTTVLNDTDPSYSYIVGNDTTCLPGTYCNGPLEDGKEFVLFLLVCNAAGCVDYEADEVYKPGVFSDNPEDDSNVGAIVGAVVGVIVITALVVVLVLFLLRRRKGRPKSDKTAKDPEPLDLLTRKRPVEIREFKQHVRRFHEDQNLLFENEFADLKNESLNFNNTSNNITRNGKKGKDMSNKKAHDKIEVITASDDTMKLLKANFIMGFSSVKDYIATQDPMSQNAPDFWRMIWEQNCRVIVMLSDLTEAGEQVPLYWPENSNEPIPYGDVIVNMTRFVDKKKYVIRHFKISMDNVTRLVTHFCLPGWHDLKGILSNVIKVAHLVRQKVTYSNSGPIVVHCSAGVGPTGTFIALDYFLQYMDKKGLDGEIDIYSFVLQMRRNRPRMVQAEPLYILIFDALAEVIEKKLEEERRILYDNPDLDPYYEEIADHCYEQCIQAQDEPEYLNEPDYTTCAET